MPSSHIGPAKVALHHIDIVRFLQDATLYRHVGIGGEVVGHIAVFLLQRPCRIIDIQLAQHHRQELGETLLEKIADIGEEEAGVPIKLATLHKHARKLAVGLLRKRLYAMHSMASRLTNLYVAITRFGSCGLYTHRKQTVVVGHKVETLAHIGSESLLVEHHLIRRHNQQIGPVVQMTDPMTSPSHTGCRVAVYRLGHDMVTLHLGQLLTHQLQINTVGIDIDVTQRQYLAHTIKGLLQLGTSRAKKVDKLFGALFPAARPKPPTLSACQNHTIIVVVVYHNRVLLKIVVVITIGEDKEYI